MSALTYQQGGKLTTLVEAQRGMTETEALHFLATGDVPDLSLPPEEIAVPTPSVQIMPLETARRWLSGETDVPLIASGILAFDFNPGQPRDSHGKWTDGAPGSGKLGAPAKLTALTRDEITARGKRVDRVLRDNKNLATDRTHATWLGPGKGVVWNADRDAAHREIVNTLYEKASAVPNDGQALIMGGPMGAGKTTTVRDHGGVDMSQYLIISPDDMKDELANRGLVPTIPDHPELTPLELSTLVHAETMRLAQLLANRAYRDRKNVIWDISMGTARGTGGHLDDLRDAGYDRVDAIVVDVPPHVSRRRVYARYGEGLNRTLTTGEGNGGRYVPRAVLMDQHNEYGQSWGLDTLRALQDEFDHWELYDNSVDGQPPKLMRETGDKL